MSSKTNIAIIDYKMSNMFSIKKALESLGHNVDITSDKRKVLSAAGAVLPGVGSFPEAMNHLRDLDLIDAINSFISTGKPFMGICLGLQLLFSRSREFGKHKGLNIIDGDVESFTKFDFIKIVPHVGWNKIDKKNLIFEEKNDPLNNVKSGEYFYFVHSYFAKPKNKNEIYSTSNYNGLQFCSSIIRDNIFACQFHPEKSGAKGLTILDNFFKELK